MRRRAPGGSSHPSGTGAAARETGSREPVDDEAGGAEAGRRKAGGAEARCPETGAAEAGARRRRTFPAEPPKPGTPRDFKVPEPKRFTLDNGLQVALVQWGDDAEGARHA